MMALEESYPSMTGMLRSIKMREKGFSLPHFKTSSRAYWPSNASTKCSPCFRPMAILIRLVKIYTLNYWSSTTIILGFGNGGASSSIYGIPISGANG
jgi:hypothetical protein